MPNKSQLIEILAERLDGDRKRAAATLDAVIDIVYTTVANGDKVAISGFGVFERRDRAARTARNPATGGSVQVAATQVPTFRPGQRFRQVVGGAPDSAPTAARAQSNGTATASRRGAVKAAPAKSTPVASAPATSAPAKATPAKAAPAKATATKANAAKTAPVKAAEPKSKRDKSSEAKSKSKSKSKKDASGSDKSAKKKSGKK